MAHAAMIIPKNIQISDDQVTMTWDIDPKAALAVNKTARAVTMGVTLAAMDGPLPVMDVVGFTVASGMAIHAWYEYFS